MGRLGGCGGDGFEVCGSADFRAALALVPDADAASAAVAALAAVAVAATPALVLAFPGISSYAFLFRTPVTLGPADEAVDPIVGWGEDI